MDSPQKQPHRGKQGSLLSKSLRVLRHSVSSFGSSTNSIQASSPGAEYHQPLTFTTLEALCRELQLVQGLESSNLLVAVDFTKSNAWTGEASFGGRCLHSITPGILNPYEETLEALCNALESFDDDNLFPCYGFGDATTRDKRVFSFYDNGIPCEGARGVLSRYRELAPHVRLAGPTSFAPIIREAMRVVLDSGCQYHMLLIIADGLVTTHPDDSPTPTMQETATAQALTDASGLPLSIVVVGVGDGPWTHNNTWCQPVRGKHHEAVTRPSGGRCFDNYHFVNATSVLHDAMQEGLDRRQCASRLAIHALMKVPEQYRAIRRLGLLGCTVSPALAAKVGPGPLAPPLVGASSGGSASTGGAASLGPLGPLAPMAVTPLCCPLTGNPMVDPVVAADGYIYERTAITRHLTRVGPRSPITKAPLAHTQLLPCNSLRNTGSGSGGPTGGARGVPGYPHGAPLHGAPLHSHSIVGGGFVHHHAAASQHHYMRMSSDPGEDHDHHPHHVANAAATHDWNRMRPSSLPAWDGSMLTTVHMGGREFDPVLHAQSNTDASMPSMHSISSASSRERQGGTPQGPPQHTPAVAAPDHLANLADDLDRLSVELGERRMSGTQPTQQPQGNIPSITAWPTMHSANVALPGGTPPTTTMRSANPFATAARRAQMLHHLTTPAGTTNAQPSTVSQPPRPSHEGVVFADDDDDPHNHGMQSAFLQGGEDEGGSLPGLEGPRPRGAVGRTITRVGTMPPVPLLGDAWHASKHVHGGGGGGTRNEEEPAMHHTTVGNTSDGGLQLPVVEETSPFLVEPGAAVPALPLFPAGAEDTDGEPSWVHAAPSATAQQLSPFVAATVQDAVQDKDAGTVQDKE